MVLKDLFKAQEELDKHINKNHNGQATFEKKVNACMVELSECVNEVRYFKFWSNKKASSRDIVIEEAADVLHFMLSIGNDLNSTTIKQYNYTGITNGNLSLEGYFIEINRSLATLYDLYNLKNKAITIATIDWCYIGILETYFGFMYKLGFTIKDLELAYYKKNTINHNRQDTGY